MKYHVKKVKRSTATGHRHITAVITTGDVTYTNQEVVNSIKAGNTWVTSVPNVPEATIRELSYCPAQGCLHRPYLTTDKDATAKNNLENLPEA
jgi:hypothetical protein